MILAPRWKGHIPDRAPHAQAVHHSVLVGNVRVDPVIALPARVVEQHGNNCTNFGYGWLVETWCRARELACAELSHRFSYSLGRALAADDWSVALTDEGAMPADVVEGMRWGVVPETAFPGDAPDVINARPEFVELEAARTHQVTGIGVIPETGAERCAAIRRALAGKFPVGFAMQVDDVYEGWRGEAVYSRFGGKSNGGHAQRIVGSRPGALLVAGSWADWGFVHPSFDGASAIAGGAIWVADDVIGDAEVCFDFYLVSAAPIVAEAA